MHVTVAAQFNTQSNNCSLILLLNQYNRRGFGETHVSVVLMVSLGVTHVSVVLLMASAAAEAALSFFEDGLLRDLIPGI